MLNLRRRPATRATRSSAHAPVAHAPVAHADLRIRSLLDDPQLRRAMGLDASAPAPSTPATATVSTVTIAGRVARRHIHRTHRTAG